MAIELFGEISSNYRNASDNIWYWYKGTNWFLKILMLPWAILASITMQAIALLFALGIILDKISVWLENQREAVVNTLEEANSRLSWQASAFITSPLKAIILAPIALFLGIFPKWSSTLVAVNTDDELTHGTDHGFFAKLSYAYFRLIQNMFANVFKHGLFKSLMNLPLTLLVLPIATSIALIFMVLIILDWLSWIVELIRQFIVTSGRSLANQSGNGLFSTIFFPTILALLTPIYVLLILIPKISSQTDA